MFEEIEASGLGQTVYDISEKKGPYQRTAKKIFDRWVLVFVYVLFNFFFFLREIRIMQTQEKRSEQTLN